MRTNNEKEIYKFIRELAGGYYTYIIRDGDIPRYCGKGRGYRILQHKNTAKWFIEVREPNYEIIPAETEQDALDLELELILQYGTKVEGGTLFNKAKWNYKSYVDGMSIEEFIERAITLHGDKYLYDAVDYKNANIPVKIFCSTHNEYFKQLPCVHLRGCGCKKCSALKQGCRSNTEEFIQKARAIHGDRYSYHSVEYITSDTKISIWCDKHNKAFKQTPAIHLRGGGCPKCGIEKCSNDRRKPLELFVHQAKEIHGAKYSYEFMEYKNTDEAVKILCKKHNTIFEQRPSAHLRGAGCPTCAPELRTEYQRTPLDVVISTLNEIFQGKYDLSKVKYLNNKIPLEIICPKHGSFFRSFSNIKRRKQLCPHCDKESFKHKKENQMK